MLGTPQNAEEDTPEPDLAGSRDETPHAFLRRVTRPWHDGVEAGFERFDLQTRDGLAGFLACQAVAVLLLEDALDRGGAADLLADWPARRRGAALRADLARLGQALPPPGIPPDLPSREHRLGALYVLEGSKLGGRLLHRRVLASPDPRVRAADAFLAHGPVRGWPTFLAVLDAGAPATEARARLAAGARGAFELFQAAAHGVPPLKNASDPAGSSRYDLAHA